ncbi:glycosyltransferase family 2 protein [Aequorivita sinensis]|uniref:glycosyltransferase family 2 protein n=1 Tax=Aequorivita sinensis TaxID=1382458 RepID=UPI0023014F2A|nr:glycosyltransferase family 2 protein [Aequorivita sinensis]
MPRFSVVIPLYNKEKDFPLTLDSVISQNFTDFEVIIVNDGSTDNSLAVAEAVSDERIKIFSKKNEGLSATRNFGVDKASAENVVFIDADDYWYPNHLQNMNAILNKFPEAKWFATAYEKKINNKLTRKMVSPLSERVNDWIGKVNFFECSLADSVAHPSSFGMKKDFFVALGGHNTAITFSEDTDLWIRAGLASPIAFSNKVSAVINLDSNNRLNHSSLKSRIYPDFDLYDKEAETNPALKQYLNVHRYSIAIQYKLAGDKVNFEKYKSKLILEGLNAKQKLLLSLPRQVLIKSKAFKEFLHQSGFYFSTYR